MCLIFKSDPKLLIAKKDIKVFKHVSLIPESINKVQSYYYFKVYNKGEVCNDTLGFLKYIHTLGLYALDRAYHSCSLDIECSITCGDLILGSPDTPNYVLCPTRVDLGIPVHLALFVIPKGSKYYLQDGMYASDQLIYTGYNQPVFDNIDINKFIGKCKKLISCAYI